METGKSVTDANRRLTKGLTKKKIPKGWMLTIQGLPLAAAVGASFLPLSRSGHQWIILGILLWLQVFIVFDCFLAGK